MGSCNETLVLLGEKAVTEELPLLGKYTFHQSALITSGSFALLALIFTSYLMIQHALHYSRPWEQRHILRILAMVPVYAGVSFISFLDYRHSIYFEVMRDCYEAFAISSFFALLCNYVDTNLHDQKNYFRQLQPKNWLYPVRLFQKITGGPTKGPFRTPRNGLTWFNVVWFGVFQYCFIRVTCTIIALITQLAGVYCEVSISPVYMHVWIMGLIFLSVTTAMFCLIQFYVQLKNELLEHQPLIKIICIKLVVFFSFWQHFLVSILSSEEGPIKPTKYVAFIDIRVGIPSTLLSIEMAVFALIFCWAFPYQPYTKARAKETLNMSASSNLGPMPPPSYVGGFGGHKAFFDAFNTWDVVKAAARGFRWVFVRSRTRHLDTNYTTTPRQMGRAPFRSSTGFPGSSSSMAIHRSSGLESVLSLQKGDEDDSKSSRTNSSASHDSFVEKPSASTPYSQSTPSPQKAIDSDPYHTHARHRDRSMPRGRKPRASTASEQYGMSRSSMTKPESRMSSPSTQRALGSRGSPARQPPRESMLSLPINPRPPTQDFFPPSARAASQAAVFRQSAPVSRPPRSMSHAHDRPPHARSYYQPSRVSREIGMVTIT